MPLMTLFGELCAQQVCLLPKSQSDFLEMMQASRWPFSHSVEKRKGCHVDVTVVNPLADSYVVNASISLGCVAEMVASKTIEKY